MNIFQWIRSKFFPERVKRLKVFKVKGCAMFRSKVVTNFNSFEIDAYSSEDAKEKVKEAFKSGLVFELSAKEKQK